MHGAQLQHDLVIFAAVHRRQIYAYSSENPQNISYARGGRGQPPRQAAVGEAC